MSTNDNGGQGDAGGVAGALDTLRDLNWPGVAALGLIAVFLVLGPRLGLDMKEAGTALAAIIAAGGLHYGRQAAKQTNGPLDERIRAGVRAVLVDELPRYVDEAVQRGIASALDEQPPAASSSPATYGGASYPPAYGDRG